MTTPEEFLARVLATVDQLAFTLSHTPRDRQEEWLKDFADRVRRQWCSLFAPHLEPKDVDEMVDDLAARVRKRRDEIEAAEVGRA